MVIRVLCNQKCVFKLSYELWFQIAQLFLRKTSFNIEIWVTFDQGQRMSLTFDLTQLHKLI